MTEAAILKILFPPDGIVPVDSLDRMQSIRAHIAALLALSQINNSSTETNEKRINSQEISRATTQRIVELREQPNANGHRRTWREVSEELGLGLSPDAARHRYQCYMAIQKAAEPRKADEESESHQASEFADTVRVSNVLVPISLVGESQAPVEKHPSDQAARIPHNETETTRHVKKQDKQEEPAPKKTKLSSIDQTILDMANHNFLPYEITGAISRTFSINLSTAEVAKRLRKIQEGRNSHDKPRSAGARARSSASLRLAYHTVLKFIVLRSRRAPTVKVMPKVRRLKWASFTLPNANLPMRKSLKTSVFSLDLSPARIMMSIKHS